MPRKSAVAAVACLLLLAHTASAALMSIDLGSEYLKVCLVKPGRTPISIAVNEMSKRKSPALVGIVNGERLLGEEAFSFAVRYPEYIFQRARDLLGKDPDDPTIAAMLTETGLPYKVVAHPKRGVASIQLPDDTIYSPEELVGSILYYARQIAEAQAGGPVLDAVISVPAFFGQRQRQAMADAATLAGLNLMGLINTHTAAALQYGIERDFTNRSQTIILYDMGSGTTEVALVKFSTYTVKEAGKPRVYNQLEVRDVEWDDSLGSNLLDMVLAKHFAAQFSEKAKLPDVDVTALPKAMAKLRRQVRRTKEILSANSAAPCTVEELYDGRDFQSSITREEFESLATGFFERAAVPLKRILERNALQIGDIDAVELLGGGSRVPRLQAALSEVLGGRGLDRHLDADEAIALGAGLFAANLSTSFRLRKFGMVDMTMYGVSLTLDHVLLAGEEGGAAGEAPAPSEPLLKVRNLLPYMKKLPNKRVVKLERLAGDPLKFSLAYNESTPHALPPGVKSAEIAEFEVTGIDGVIQRYNTSGQVSVRFEADYSGLLRLEKVEAVVEYEVLEEKIIEVPLNESSEGAAEGAKGAEGEEATAKKDDAASEGKAEQEAEQKEAEAKSTDADSDTDDNGGEGDGEEGSGKEGEEDGKEQEASGDASKEEGAKEEPPAAASATANGTEAETNGTAKPATTVKRIQVPKTKVAKVSLKVGGKGWLSPPLSEADLSEAKQVLANFVAAETRKRDLAKSRNDLESYIIAMKEALETDELVQKVSTEEQREAFRSRLTDEEDWLYMEADDSEGSQQFKDRLKQLKDIGEPIKRRAEELELRPKVVEGVRNRLELHRSVAKAWQDTKPWITEAEREDIVKQLADLEADLEAKVAAQAAKADHEEPAFSVTELATAWEKVDKAFNKANNKKKPKPPPEPKPAAGADGAGSASEEAGKEDDMAGDSAGDTKPESESGDQGPGAERATGGADKEEPKKSDKAQEDKASTSEDRKKDAKEEPKKDSKAKKEEPKKDSKAKKEEPKKDSKAKKEEPKKDSKAKKEEPKKDSKAKKEEPKKDSKAKKEEPKKDSKAKKEEPKKASNSKASGKKDDKKSWSWNKKSEEL